jgi:hypothetical protein
MSEEKNKVSSEDTNAGDKPAAVAETQSGNSETERLEEENRRLRVAIEERVILLEKAKLSGIAEAGKPIKTPEQMQKEKDEEEIKKRLSLSF